MTEQEIEDAARFLLEQHNEHYEFALVYEDDDYCELDPEVQRAILDKMYAAKITISWD